MSSVVYENPKLIRLLLVRGGIMKVNGTIEIDMPRTLKELGVNLDMEDNQLIKCEYLCKTDEFITDDPLVEAAISAAGYETQLTTLG